MKPKEIILAITIGLVLSGITAGGIIRAKKAIQNFTPTINKPSPSPSPSPKPQQKLYLKITDPKDNSIITESKVILKGKTLPKTYITILTDNSEYLIVPNEIGQFTQEISLIKGVNVIKVTVYKENGDSTQKTLNLVYTTKEI